MENLKELVEIITRNKVKKIEVIGNPNDKGSKLDRLYHAIREGKVSNDDEAFKLLYPKGGNKNAYHKLKHVLTERLKNTFFFIDTKTNKYSKVQETYFKCTKDVSVVEMLGMRNATNISMPMAEKLLKTTLKYNFIDLSISLSRKLATHYAQRLGDRKRFGNYNNLLYDLTQLNLKEALAERYYLDIISYYVRNKSTKKFISNLAKKYYNEVSVIQTKRSSPKLVRLTFMLKICTVMSENNYKETIPLCDQAIKELYSFPVLDIQAILEITSQKIASCIHLKHYEEAKAGIDRCFELQEEGRPNWFKTHELHMTLCLHTRRYEEAWSIYQKATSHKGFSKIPANWKEIWKIFEAWLWFLKVVGQIKVGATEMKAFKAARFLNEVPTFSHDKRGMNVTILISQIVIALAEKNPDLVMDRVESLKKYRERYLKKDDNYRSQCFLHMIEEMEKQQFRKQDTINSTKKLLANMSSEPLDITDQSHDLEILPLEDCWDFIIASLPAKGF